MRFIIAKVGLTCIGSRIIGKDTFTNLPASGIPVTINFKEPTGSIAKVKMEEGFVVAYTDFNLPQDVYVPLMQGYPAIAVNANPTDGTMRLVEIGIVPMGDGVVKSLNEQLQSQRKNHKRMRNRTTLSELYSDIKYKYGIQSNYIVRLHEKLKASDELRKALIAELTAVKQGDSVVHFTLDGVNPEEVFVRRGLYDKRCKELGFWKRKVEKLQEELAVLRQSDIS